MRCVRGNGAGEGQNGQAKEPPDHYAVATAAGETADNYTGLVWQQGSSPATRAWVDAANYCTTLGLNGHTWRVPSLNELASTPALPVIALKSSPGNQNGCARWHSHASNPTRFAGRCAVVRSNGLALGYGPARICLRQSLRRALLTRCVLRRNPALPQIPRKFAQNAHWCSTAKVVIGTMPSGASDCTSSSCCS